MKQATKNELRCLCSRQPLLAVYGLDDRGKVYLHVKVYKARRIYGEILVRAGDVSLLCRECFRWYRVVVRQNQPSLEETARPEIIDQEDGTGFVDPSVPDTVR